MKINIHIRRCIEISKVIRVCLVCGREFKAKSQQIEEGRGKYCSRKCYNESQNNKIKQKCLNCGEEFETWPSRVKNGLGKYCSRKCYNELHEKTIKCICEHCGKEFEVNLSLIKKGSGRYCSKRCFGKSQQNKVKRVCRVCGKEFEIKKSLIKVGGGKFCSKECHNKSKENKIKRICVFCKNEFETTPSQIKTGGGKYCSVECRSKSFIGENNPNWTGGISKIYCEKFNTNFKRRVSAFWYLNNKNICPVCEKPIIEETPNCHHAYYDKKACCLTDLNGKYFSNLGIKNNKKIFEIIGDPNKFIPLHKSCHGKTNSKSKRKLFARKFEILINGRFGGKSYFTKEEYKEFLICHPGWKIPYK